MSGHIEGVQGWVRDQVGYEAYAAEIARDEPPGFWDKLRELDDRITVATGTQDRYWYRSLTTALLNAGLVEWLVSFGDGTFAIKSFGQGRVGSCVGNADAKEASYRSAIEVYAQGEPEAFKGMFSPEWSYYASRAECGMLGRGGGSTGYGAARAATKRGLLVRGVYGGVDLAQYSESRCEQWGTGRGVPQEAIDEAAKHTCKFYVKVDTAEKVWLCAGVGIPVNQCSSRGWKGVRQEGKHQGIIMARGSWMHSMCIGASRWVCQDGAKAVEIDQSWLTQTGKQNGVEYGDWTTGPYHSPDSPRGSFGAYLDDVGGAVEEGDTFVDCEFNGYKPEDVPQQLVRI